MRFTRISLRHFRGVVDCTIEPLPTGVTIIQGPNEAGKTSIADAIEVVFEHRDSTARCDVKALQPVGRDVGTEIGIDVEVGAFAFSYFKRFHRERETWLRIAKPRAEQLTGREAHERVLEILDRSIDRPLWEALRVPQGREAAQAEFAGSRSLVAALSRAASQAPLGEREVALLDAATRAFRRYYTATGRPGAELRAASCAVTEASGRVEELQGRLAELQEKARRSAELSARSSQLRVDLAAADAAAAQHEADAAARSERLGRVESLKLAAERAAADAAAAAERAETRRQLVADHGHQAAAAVRAAAAAGSVRERLAAAEAEEAACAEALAAASTALRAAEELVELRRADLAACRDEAELAALCERRQAAARLRAEADAAGRELERNRVDLPALAAIRGLRAELERAQAALEVASPRLLLHALRAAQLQVGDQELVLGAGDRLERPVTGQTTLTVPGLLEVTVTAGAEARELTERARAATRALDDRLREAGVASEAEAEVAAAERAQAQRTLHHLQERLRDCLAGRSEADLEERIGELDRRYRTAQARRRAGRPLPGPPGDELDAEEAERAAAVALAGARRAHEARRAELEAVSAQAGLLRRALGEQELCQRLHAERAAALAAALRAARAGSGDALLLERLDDAAARADAAAVAYRAELEALDAEQPDDVAQRAQTARAAAAALAERLEAVDGEARDLAARLEERGQDGLEEALDSARSRLAQARRESASLELRAGAARHLRDTLVSCRDAARDAYSRPLRERIEELSRALFGPSFQIELSDDLRIASRTLDGQTLPFAALSTGTREQLSLIARLAGALLVADDGGAPVILDDTLGSCDAERLTAMASILALAGRRCQVLVLTCFPERFRSVTGARVIRLGPAGRVAGERSALAGSGT